MPRLAVPYPADFLLLFGAQEIAERAANEGTIVPGALLTATVQGADLSPWTAEEQAAAAVALVRIERVLSAATADLRSRLARDDLYWSEASSGAIHVMALARALLYDDATTDAVTSGVTRADEWVRSVNGRLIRTTAERN